jgi:hypothetical protein
MVECEKASPSVTGIIDRLLAKEIAMPQGTDIEQWNGYFAFVPDLSIGGNISALIDRTEQPYNSSNQLWMTFRRYAFNSAGQKVIEPAHLVCQLYNASYNISLQFEEGNQTITTNSLSILNMVDYPQANLSAPSDLVQHAYSAYMWALTEQLVGSMGFYNDTSPNSLTPTFTEINTLIGNTLLLGTSDLDPFFDLHHYSRIGDQRLQDIQLARNRTLDVLIRELAFNTTLSFMNSDLLS